MAREVIISCWWPWSWCTSEYCVVHSTIRVVCLKQHWWPRSRDKPFFPLQLWQRVKLFPSILAAVCVWKLLFARSYFSSDRPSHTQQSTHVPRPVAFLLVIIRSIRSVRCDVLSCLRFSRLETCCQRVWLFFCLYACWRIARQVFRVVDASLRRDESAKYEKTNQLFYSSYFL